MGDRSYVLLFFFLICKFIFQRFFFSIHKVFMQGEGEGLRRQWEGVYKPCSTFSTIDLSILPPCWEPHTLLSLKLISCHPKVDLWVGKHKERTGNKGQSQMYVWWIMLILICLGEGPLGVPVGGTISVSLISMGRSAHCGCTVLWLESKDV